MRSWVAATVMAAVLEALLGVGAEKLGNIEVITRGELGKEGLNAPTSSLVLGDGEPRLRVQNDAPPPPISYLPPVQTPLPIEPTGAPGGEIGVAPGGLYEPPVLTPVAAPVQPPPGLYGSTPQESFAGLDNTPVAVGGLGISPVVSTGSAGGYDETYVDTTDDTESGSEGFLSSFRNSKFALIGGVLGAKAAVAQGFKNAKESFVSGITSAVAAKSAAFSSFKAGSSSAQNSYEIGGGDTYGAGQYQGDHDGGKYQGSYEGGQYQGSYGSGQYQGSYGAGEYQGSLGSGQYQGSLGSGQYQGNLGSGQYQGNLGSGQYQGSQGSGQYQGSYGGGEYQGNLGSGSNDGLVGVGGEAVKPVTPIPLPVSPYPIYPPYPQPVYSKPLYSLALYPVAPVYRPNLNPFARIQAKVEGIKAKVEGIAQAKAAAVVGAIAKFEAAKTDLKNKFTSGFQKGFTSFQSNPTKPIYPTYQVNLAKPNYQTYPVKDFPNKQTSPTNLTFPANPTYQTNQSYSSNQNYSTKSTNPLSQGGLKVKALPKVKAPFYAIQPVYLYSYGRRPW